MKSWKSGTPGGDLGVRRWLAAGAAALIVGLVLPVGADAQVLGPLADFSGFATGSAVHLDLIQSGATRVEDTEVAFSGASVSSKAGLTNPILNEMQRPFQPALPGKFSYGKGTGLEVGLGVTPTTANQVIVAGLAEAASPPATDLITKEIAVPGDPVAYASLARGQARARLGADDPCNLLGADLAYGLGYVADAQLVDTGAGEQTPQLDKPLVAVDHPDPARSVSQTRSRDLFIPQVGKDGKIVGTDFGLMSEVRETIAPITLFKGTANQITIELLGEWVLQAVAGGLPGTGFVHYGPGTVSPETPILRTLDAANKVTNILKFQDITGKTGLVVIVPSVAEIAIGEDPRAIGGDDKSLPTEAADGTLSSGAVDVLRVKLLEQKDASGAVTFRAADLRVGHMEVRAQVPAGGIRCPLPVSKVAVPPSVVVGNNFVTTITVKNPFQCPLTDVSVSDAITTQRGARFKVESSSPAADSAPTGENLAAGTVAWNNIGSIAANSSKDVAVTLKAQGDEGLILDTATASGTLSCPPGSGLGSANVAGVVTAKAKVNGVASLQVPVGAVAAKRTPRTGGSAAAAAAGGLALIAVAGMGLLKSRATGG